MATASTIASNGVIRSSTPSGLTSLRTHLQARHASNGSSPIPNSNTSNASRSSAPSPSVSPTRPKFDGPLLKAYIKKLLASTLGSSTWPDAKDKDRVRLWCREIGERVKERAVEIEPRGFKYMVTTQINENLGQGGRADLVCHWEDSDTVVQEVYANYLIFWTTLFASSHDVYGEIPCRVRQSRRRITVGSLSQHIQIYGVSHKSNTIDFYVAKGVKSPL